MDLIALAECIEGRKRHADLCPEGANDELAPAGGANGGEELDVLPGVERRSVDGGISLEQLRERPTASAASPSTGIHQPRDSMRSGTASSTVSITWVSYSTHCV